MKTLYRGEKTEGAKGRRLVLEKNEAMEVTAEEQPVAMWVPSNCTVRIFAPHGVIFRNELENLQQLYAGRLAIEHVLSAPNADWNGLTGRFSPAQLRETLLKHTIGIQSQHFMCGPNDFMNTIQDTLAQMGMPRDRIFRESFTLAPGGKGESATQGDSLSDVVMIGDISSRGTPEEITAVIASR